MCSDKFAAKCSQPEEYFKIKKLGKLIKIFIKKDFRIFLMFSINFTLTYNGKFYPIFMHSSSKTFNAILIYQDMIKYWLQHVIFKFLFTLFLSATTFNHLNNLNEF